jgi:hypothetical protein
MYKASWIVYCNKYLNLIFNSGQYNQIINIPFNSGQYKQILELRVYYRISLLHEFSLHVYIPSFELWVALLCDYNWNFFSWYPVLK